MIGEANQRVTVREACVRGGKRYIAINKDRKRFQAKSPKPRKSVKLSSASWYQKAAARVGIIAAPSIVPETD